MADLYYYEEGYIEAKYYAYVADAAVDMTSYFEEGYIEAYFYEQQNGVAVLTFEGDIINIIVEASGSWTSEFSQSASGINIKPLSSTIASEFAQTADNLRLRPLDSSLSSEFAHTALVGKIQQAEAAFTGAFSPTLTADAFKNHTAVIESISAMTVDAVVNRSSNVLLEHIANLNAMAIKDAVSSATLSTNFSQTTTANKTQQIQASITTNASLTSLSGKLKTVSATPNASSTLFVSRNTNGRPRNLGGIDYQYVSEYFNSSIKKFGTHSFGGTASAIYTIPNHEAIVYGYKNNKTVIQGWYRRQSSSAVTGIFVFGQNWRLDSLSGSTGSLRFRTYADFGDGILSTNNDFTTSPAGTNTWYHWAVINDGTWVAYYWDGIRVGLESSSYQYQSNTGISFKAGAFTQCFDDISIHRDTTLGYDAYNNYSITVPTSATVNDSYVMGLWHGDLNGYDDAYITHSGQSNLSTAFAISAEANPNTKSATANVTATASTTCLVDRIRDCASAMASTSSLDINAGKLKGITDTLSSEFTLQDGLARIRFGESSQNSLFSPSVTVVATKSGEILLQPEFAVTVNANSFTEVPASLASQFAVTADIDGIARITSASLSTATAVSAVIGTQESAVIAISGAFNAIVNVQYFEGTSLMAPMTATMAVTARKTARITRTLQSALTLSADVRENAQAPAANGITSTYQERIDVTLNYTYTYVKTSSTRRSFSFTSDTAVPGGQVGIGALSGSSLFPNGTLLVSNSASANIEMYVYVYGQSGSSDWYDVYTYNYDLGIVDSVNLGGNQFVNGSGTLRLVFDAATTGLLTAYLDGSATPISLSAPSTTFKNRIYWPSFEPFYISNQNGRFGWPPILFPTVNNIRSNTGNTNLALTSVAYSDEAYNLYYGPQEYAVADLVDLDFASLSVSAITVVFLQAGLLAGTFAQTTSGNRIRFSTSTLTAQITVSANAGLQAVGTASVNAASTLQASVARTRSTTAAVAVACTTTCAPTRVRYQAANLTATATVDTQAVKQTGNVIAVESTVAQTTQGQRIRYAGADFSAFNSTVTAAAKNATGTVTLEAQALLSAQPVKDAQGAVALTAQAEITANTAQGKIVGFAATLASAVTQDTIGDRIQPAGSDMLSEFAQSTNTNDSKITRIVSAITSTATVTVSADRSRSVISLQASAGTLTCQNDTIRFGSAQFTDTFTILASPTFIVRITADFTAFNTVLTLGEVINLDPYLTITIEPESRTVFILPENRIISIESETRVNII